MFIFANYCYKRYNTRIWIFGGYEYRRSKRVSILHIFCYKRNFVYIVIRKTTFCFIYVCLFIKIQYIYIVYLTFFVHREGNMLNDAPDAAIEDSYNVKNRKGGRRVFAGGCARRPDAPINGKIKCSLDRYLCLVNN